MLDLSHNQGDKYGHEKARETNAIPGNEAEREVRKQVVAKYGRRGGGGGILNGL